MGASASSANELNQQLPTDIVSSSTEDGVVQNPRDGGRGSKSWIATVRKDRSAPGGLAREFWARAQNAGFHHVPANLAPGDVIEFAGDEISRRGRRRYNRIYSRVVEVRVEKQEIRRSRGQTTFAQVPSLDEINEAHGKITAEKSAEMLGQPRNVEV